MNQRRGTVDRKKINRHQAWRRVLERLGMEGRQAHGIRKWKLVGGAQEATCVIAYAIIYYNSAILSRLLTKYESSGNAKALALIKKISPAAWCHIHLNGHYTFLTGGQVIDLDAIVAELKLE